MRRLGILLIFCILLAGCQPNKPQTKIELELNIDGQPQTVHFPNGLARQLVNLDKELRRFEGRSREDYLNVIFQIPEDPDKPLQVVEGTLALGASSANLLDAKQVLDIKSGEVNVRLARVETTRNDMNREMWIEILEGEFTIAGPKFSGQGSFVLEAGRKLKSDLHPTREPRFLTTRGS